jgi:hypothetical protein
MIRRCVLPSNMGLEQLQIRPHLFRTNEILGAGLLVQRADWNALRGGAHHRVSLYIRVLAYIVHLYGRQTAKALGWPLPKTRVGYNGHKNCHSRQKHKKQIVSDLPLSYLLSDWCGGGDLNPYALRR